jgi:hypothetical protein
MMSRRSARHGRSILISLSSLLVNASPLAAFAGLAVIPSVALAQKGVKQMEPTYYVVTAERANVRAGNHDSLYVVAEVKKGDIITVDGQDNTWTRVVYNSDWPAFVGASEGSYDAATQTFTLSKPSTLLAYSVINPQYCWQALLPENKPLASGSKLKVQGEIKDAAGTLKGYRVNAPEGSRGFIESRSLTPATKEQADAHRAKIGAPAPAPTAPAQPATPAPTPTPTPTPTPAGTNPGTPSTDRSLVEPTVPPTPGSQPTNPVTPPATAPGATPTATAPGGQPTVIDQQSDPNKPATAPTNPATPANPTDGSTPAATPPAKAKDRTTASLEQIETAFAKVNSRDADIFTAEYDSLLAEINKTIGELTDSPVDAQRKRQLQLRADVLKLRIGVRDSLKASEEAKRSLNTEITAASKVIAEAEKSRVYNLVGMLTASSIYDGKNLPVMYRVVSADAKVPTTLGYIDPAQDPTLASKVGQLVGVIGEAIVDPTLKIAVIRPVRVDLVGAGSGSPNLPLLQPTQITRPAAEPVKPVPAAVPAPTTAPASTEKAPPKPVDIIK